MQRAAPGRDELTAAPVPLLGLLRQRLGDDGVERLGKVGVVFGDARWLVVHVAVEGGQEAFTLKRRLSGEALEEKAAEGVNVGRRLHGLARDLLRRGVVGGAHEVPGLGETGSARRLRETEVGEVDVLGRVGGRVDADQDVGRLHISVYEPARMGGVEGIRDPAEELERTVRLDPALSFEHSREIGALDMAHGQVQAPLGLACVVDRDHVRVVEAGGDLRLAKEAIPEQLVLAELLRQQL